MNHLRKSALIFLGSFLLTSLSAHAAVSARQANELGKSLTPFGSIKSGNAAGTIPEWDGGLTEPPAEYKKAGQHHPDPFASDEIRFSIDKDNYQGFKKYLSEGVLSLFEKYPDSFRMDVYPSRRTHAMPKWVMDNSKKNATKASLTTNGNGITGAFGGIAFPILHGDNRDRALQVMWNHMTRWRGVFVTRRAAEIPVQRNGTYAPVIAHNEAFFNFHNPKGSEKTLENILFYYLSFNKQPARLAGGALLVHETIDQTKKKRQAWDYNSGQRRVRRAPNLAYDSPIAASDNLRTADDTDMYNGAPDKYDWEYVGVKEVFIPYNNYAVASPNVKYRDLIWPGHVNPEYVRWEMHRVHVVEATLKKRQRHIYARRTFYVDEDSWNIALIDKYDRRGDLWRVSISLLKNHYELPGTFTAGDLFLDLRSRRYDAMNLYSEESSAPIFENKVPNRRYFKPSSLRRRGR